MQWATRASNPGPRRDGVGSSPLRGRTWSGSHEPLVLSHCGPHSPLSEPGSQIPDKKCGHYCLLATVVSLSLAAGS